MATIHSLPHEVLSQIMDYAEGETRPLCGFARVCRAWRAPAQRTLFASPHFTSTWRANLWLACPVRGNYRTKALSLRHDVEESVGALVLEECPHLVAFSCDAGESDGRAYRWCLKESIKGLKHLAVTHPESFPLDVDAVPLQCRLVSFEVRPDYQIFDEQCISTILSSSMDTLTHLSIIDEVDEASSDLVCYFQRSPPRALHTLSITQRSERGYTRLISSLPALSTLKVETFDGYSFAAIGVSEAPNLESLSFGELHDFTSFEDEDIDELLRVIRLPSLQRLRHLRFRTIPKSAFEGTAGLTLLKECEERSITFESSEGSLTYRDLEEDWLS